MAYSGEGLCGWQRQQNAVSVQQLLEEALGMLFGQAVSVTGCGRTDAGVNASRYFAHFDIADSAASCAVDGFGKVETLKSGIQQQEPLLVEQSKLEFSLSKRQQQEPLLVEQSDLSLSKIQRQKSAQRLSLQLQSLKSSEQQLQLQQQAAPQLSLLQLLADKEKFIYKLNSILPKEIVVYDIYEVQQDMHARFSAISRTYKYFVHTEKNPFIDRYSHLIHFSPDIEAINTACKYLLTQKDFTSFAKLHSDNKNNLCTLSEAVFENFEENRFVFTFTANRFLRNMVRALVGTLLEVGCGKISQKQLIDIVEAKDRSAAGVSVPAKALFLTDVLY